LEEVIREKETIPNAYADYQEPVAAPHPEIRALRAENGELQNMMKRQTDEINNWR
jgi:predicted nuclease with TOPRIM domain